MGEIDLVRQPGGRNTCSVFEMHRLPEERQLISKPMPVVGAQITGVIPPFRLEIVMRKVVSGKSVRIVGSRCCPALRRKRANRGGQGGNNKKHASPIPAPTLHGWPRWD